MLHGKQVLVSAAAARLAGMERLNTAVDVRHARRALTADEVAKLVQSARTSGVRVQGYSGEERARIYLVSFLTGLRRNELASMTRRSFDLDAEQPTVTVEAVSSKHRRKDVLPLHPELVDMLRDWFKGMAPGEKIFPMLARRKTWRMVKKDLERVGIPYETEAGSADFHAAGRQAKGLDLEAACRRLLSRQCRALQIRYYFDGAEWTDTLLSTPAGIRAVRCRHASSGS